MIKALDSTGGSGGAGTIPDKEPIMGPTTTGVNESACLYECSGCHYVEL